MKPSPWAEAFRAGAPGARVTRRALLGGILAAPAASARARTAQGEEARRLLAAMRSGSVVAVMRHGITDRSQVDTGDLSDRAGQRNLSEAGRQQSLRTGRALQKMNMPIGEVLTSPVFRARETAELAFGNAARVEPNLTADDYTPDPALLRQRVAWLRRRTGNPLFPGVTDILVGHIVPLSMVLGRSLAQEEFPEGSFAVFTPGAAAGRLMGIIAAETIWAAAGV